MKLFAQYPKGKVFYFLFENWWVATFILMALAIYVQALYKKKELSTHLREKALMLKNEKNQLIEESKYLSERFKSEEDLEWVELVLKQKLGVVPEGETKVVFIQK